jgi:transcription elongation factor Elf1
MLWYKKDSISREVLDLYFNQKNKQRKLTSCNTDKTSVYACNLKCKTRGIELACSNCGIVLAFRELYGSESLTQVAYMYLDLVDCIPQSGGNSKLSCESYLIF